MMKTDTEGDLKIDMIGLNSRERPGRYKTE